MIGFRTIRVGPLAFLGLAQVTVFALDVAPQLGPKP